MTPNVSSKSSVLKQCQVQTWDLKYEIQCNKCSLYMGTLERQGLTNHTEAKPGILTVFLGDFGHL